MTTIIKAANAAQFLSLVPQLLGFTPTRSLVLVPFAGGRSLGAMRLDLPADDAEVDSFASTCVGMICRIPDADAVTAVVYTDERFGHDRPPRDDLARALLSRADACGLRATDALCVAVDAWGSYLDPECPPGGRPLDDLGPSERMSLPPVVGDQSTGAQLPVLDLANKERVRRALAALQRAVAVVCGGEGERGGDRESATGSAGASGRASATKSDDTAPDASERAGAPGGRIDPQALAAVCLLDDLPTLFEDSLRGDPALLDPFRAAALVWCLARPSLRDIALVQWCSGFAAGDEALDAQLRWEAGEPYPAHLAQQMWGEGGRPDVRRLETALALARHIAAVAPRVQRPGALSACAWLSWALGRSTRAEHYAAEAREIEPEHGLSEIVLSFVAAGHLPDWAFRRPSRDPRPSRSGIAKKKVAKRR